MSRILASIPTKQDSKQSPQLKRRTRKIETSLVANLDKIINAKTKALIANPRIQVFLRRRPYKVSKFSCFLDCGHLASTKRQST